MVHHTPVGRKRQCTVFCVLCNSSPPSSPFPTQSAPSLGLLPAVVSAASECCVSFPLLKILDLSCPIPCPTSRRIGGFLTCYPTTPKSTNTFTFFYDDVGGIHPTYYRHMEGFGVHTCTLISKAGKSMLCENSLEAHMWG